MSGSGWTPRVASFYSGSAQGYEELWAPELLKLSADLVDELPLVGARRVLDLGSGVGSLLSVIQRHQPEALVVGTDVAHGMLRLAPETFPRVVSDAQDLPFKDRSFDAAVLAFMLFHVPKPARALTETHRVLRVGAAIGTLTWGSDPSYLAFDLWDEELEARGASAAPALSRHDLVDTEDKVAEMLRAAGFSDIRTWVRMYELQMDLESFLRHRTGHGTSKHRFESLPDEARAEVIDSLRDRLRNSEPDAFFDRSEVIYATAVAAGAPLPS